MRKKLTAVLLLTAMTAGLAACGSNKGADTNTDAPAQTESKEKTVTTEASGAAQNADIQGTITLAAAASLEKSFTEQLIPMFEEQYPEVSIEELMTAPENYSHRSRLAQMWTSSFPQR